VYGGWAGFTWARLGFYVNKMGPQIINVQFSSKTGVIFFMGIFVA